MKVSIFKFSQLLQFIIVVSALLLSSCTYNFGEPKLPTKLVVPNFDKPKPDPLSGTMKVEFATIRDHALNSCKACHNALQEPILNSLETWKTSSEKVLNAIQGGLNGVKPMPPVKDGYDALNNCQIDLVKSWISQGAPEVSEVLVSSIPSCDGGLGGPKNILEMPINYQSLHKMILQPKCISCHNENNNTDAAFSLLYPYEELAGRRGLIGSDSDHSKLVFMLAAKNESRMPPLVTAEGKPLEGLTDDELEFVKRLVDAGFPEN